MGVFQCNVFDNAIFQGPCDVARPSGGAFYPTAAEIRALKRRHADQERERKRKEEELLALIAKAYDMAMGVWVEPDLVPEIEAKAEELFPEWISSPPDPPLRIINQALVRVLAQRPERQPTEDEQLEAYFSRVMRDYENLELAAVEDGDFEELLDRLDALPGLDEDDPEFKRMMRFITRKH